MSSRRRSSTRGSPARWRDLGRAAGSVSTGLQHVEVAPGREATPLHCHSASEEIFVVLDGHGELVLDGEPPTAVRAGHVIARPPATARRPPVPRRSGRAHLPRLRHARAQRHLLLPALEQARVRRPRGDRAGRSRSTTGTARTEPRPGGGLGVCYGCRAVGVVGREAARLGSLFSKVSGQPEPPESFAAKRC